MNNTKWHIVVLSVIILVCTGCKPEYIEHEHQWEFNIAPVKSITINSITTNMTATGKCPCGQTGTITVTLKEFLRRLPDNSPTSPYILIANVSSIEGLGDVLPNYSNLYISLDLSGSTITSIGDYAFNSCIGLTR